MMLRGDACVARNGWLARPTPKDEGRNPSGTFEDRGASVATHEMRFARQVADLMIFMDDGEIVEASPPDEFFENPKNERTKTFLSQILHH